MKRANGMLAPVDISGRTPTPCYALMQVENGEFVRVFPEEQGTFDCEERNLVTMEQDLLG